MEERERILRLLEEGRINAQQAARLIEALSARRVQGRPVAPFFARRGWRRHLFQDIDKIPEAVSAAISESVRVEHGDNDCRENKDFPGKSVLRVGSVSGDITVRVWSNERIRVGFSRRLVKIDSCDDVIAVSSVSGDVLAQVPFGSRLELSTISGNVSVAGVRASVTARSVAGSVTLASVVGQVLVGTVSGDVQMSEVSGELIVSSRSGDVVVKSAAAVSGSITTRSGNIAIVLAPEPDIMLDIVSGEGSEVDLATKVPHEVLESTSGHRRVRFGQGRYSLILRSEIGDIVVCGREEQERWFEQ